MRRTPARAGPHPPADAGPSLPRGHPGLSGEKEPVVRSSRRTTPDPLGRACPGHPRLLAARRGVAAKTWVAGTSPAKGSYGCRGRSNASHCVQQNFPQTALRGHGGGLGWGLAPNAASLLRHFAFLGLDRLLGGRIDPPGLKADRVFWRDGGAPELVPVGNAERGDMVMRDQVIAILQYPVEGVRVGQQAGPVGRPDQSVDQLVDDFAPDAHQGAAALLVGGLRAPIFALLVARGQ